MSDISARFAALPRARRGTTSVVIVDEEVLAALIADAQASEASLVADAFRREARARRAPLAKTWVDDYDAEHGRWAGRGNRDYLLDGRQAELVRAGWHSVPVEEYVDGALNLVPPGREDTQANETHGLTPKPLSEQVPGAWNFVEQQSLLGALDRAITAARADGRCPCGSNLYGGRGGCSECR